MTSPWTPTPELANELSLLEQQRREHARDLSQALAERPGGLFSIKRAEAALIKPPPLPSVVQEVSMTIN